MKSPDRDAADELAPHDWLPLAVQMEREGKEALGLACGHLCVQGSELIATLAKRVNAQAPELATLRRRVEEMRRNRLEEAEALRRRVEEMEPIVAAAMAYAALRDPPPPNVVRTPGGLARAMDNLLTKCARAPLPPRRNEG